MSDNENLQKLLRLKRFETPGEEYFENFLDELKERQRQDALKQSAFALLRERAAQWYHELGNEKWAVPVGGVAAAAVAFLAFGGNEQEEEISEVSEKPQIIELRISEPGSRLSVPGENASSSSKDSVLPATYSGGLREL